MIKKRIAVVHALALVLSKMPVRRARRAYSLRGIVATFYHDFNTLIQHRGYRVFFKLTHLSAPGGGALMTRAMPPYRSAPVHVVVKDDEE
jgi:hypothetical protein